MKDRPFVTGNYFHPSVMFVGKAAASKVLSTLKVVS